MWTDQQIDDAAIRAGNDAIKAQRGCHWHDCTTEPPPQSGEYLIFKRTGKDSFQFWREIGYWTMPANKWISPEGKYLEPTHWHSLPENP